MCYFHVKQACKDYIAKHGHGSAEKKNEIWEMASEDIDVLRGAQTIADFQSRTGCKYKLKKPDTNGLAWSHCLLLLNKKGWCSGCSPRCSC